MDSSITLLGCGDVGPVHEPVRAFCTRVTPVLATADLRFAQVERVYSDRGALQVHSGGSHSRLKPHMAEVFSECGFDVVSVASNHAMDWGPDALLDTLDLLQSRGIRTVGAGPTLEEARAPAILERRGVRVAFLAYCSVLREGYAATASQPGVAPLRVHTYYEPAEYQPGMPPHTVTIPDEQDLAGLIADVRAVRGEADVVVVSLHWGLHFIPRAIAQYQPRVARAAFDAGVDLILGHHAHVPKAVALHGGRVCFYSLSNFIMSAPPAKPERHAAFAERYGTALDPDYPHLPYGVDAKRSLIAKATLSPRGVERVAFLPVLIDTELRPEVLCSPEPRFAEAVRYMEWASVGFEHRFRVEGDEVVVQDKLCSGREAVGVSAADAGAA
jgi:poly-gamma-glutamate capsule biosynthesis protein CapA/YwtB (metallophosphatase superfamily)